ncbi:nascent polypeptide-associated complex subunit beta [Nadsonia fulvescens var. elongata DSM 6958]|uniref:Nascent polypeptide-associated complex subunit beta n=1 Tax=Nadsonia fulvescens var. elongata DSM 6958 TaxID=857566 RepID=A0A1E3PS35_9ASCO|nr:nascent polypeptide-associated complex subunit beta [Nadsonia fulvescens var. elongata DSM 6958]
MPVDQEKLAKLQKATRIGGKGTPRRKAKRAPKVDNSVQVAAENQKLQQALQKLNAQTVPGIEEVNMFQEDGKVLNFNRVQVQGSVPDNTFAVFGNSKEKELTDLMPGILAQMGPESLSQLQKIVEQLKLGQEGPAGEAGDEVPELVEGETFEDNVE